MKNLRSSFFAVYLAFVLKFFLIKFILNFFGLKDRIVDLFQILK